VRNCHLENLRVKTTPQLFWMKCDLPLQQSSTTHVMLYTHGRAYIDIYTPWWFNRNSIGPARELCYNYGQLGWNSSTLEKGLLQQKSANATGMWRDEPILTAFLFPVFCGINYLRHTLFHRYKTTEPVLFSNSTMLSAQRARSLQIDHNELLIRLLWIISLTDELFDNCDR